MGRSEAIYPIFFNSLGCTTFALEERQLYMLRLVKRTFFTLIGLYLVESYTKQIHEGFSRIALLAYCDQNTRLSNSRGDCDDAEQRQYVAYSDSLMELVDYIAFRGRE